MDTTAPAAGGASARAAASAAQEVEESPMKTKRKKSVCAASLLFGAQEEEKKKRKRSSKQQWTEMLYELILYKHHHGTTVVNASTNAELAHWVSHTRSQKGRNELSQDQKHVLDEIGFVWNLRKNKAEVEWDLKYELLKKFKEKHGHCAVPVNNAELGAWVQVQRSWQAQTEARNNNNNNNQDPQVNDSNKKIRTMTQERKKKLDDIGFVWKRYSRTGWDDRVQELMDYKKKYGHTRVPQHWPENKDLGKWVARQRCQYAYKLQGKKSSLTPERMEQLEGLGFDWGKTRPNARRENKKKKVSEQEGAG